MVEYPIAVFIAHSRTIAGDESGYRQYASNLLHHGTFSLSTAAPFRPSVLRTPGYPAFLAALRAVGLGGQNGVIAVQLALVGVAAVATYILVRKITGDELAATASAVATVVYLPLLEYSAYYLTEVLSFALAAVIMALLFGRRDLESPRRSIARFAAAGLLLGYLSLVRPEYYLIGIPLVVIALIVGGNGRASRTACVLVAAAALLLVVTPWMGRNYALVHQPLPGGANDGASLYASALQYNGTISAKFTTHDWDVYRANLAKIDAPAIAGVHVKGRTADARRELAVNVAERRAASSTIRAEPKTDVLRRVPVRMAYLWSVADQPPSEHFGLWHHAAQAQFALYVILAVGGLFSLRHRRGVALALSPLLVWPLYLTIVHSVFHIEARYSMPGRELLMVLVGLGAAALLRALSTRAAAT